MKRCPHCGRPIKRTQFRCKVCGRILSYWQIVVPAVLFVIGLFLVVHYLTSNQSIPVKPYAAPGATPKKII